MVRLYYLAVVQKSEGKNDVLSECSDLSDFSFFRRIGAKEFMRFSCSVLVGRTDPGCRVSVREQMYVCHVSVKNDRLAAVAVTDDEYPHTAAHMCLQNLLDDFQYHQNRYGAANAENYTGINDLMEKYKDPGKGDRLHAIREQLDETKIILHQTLESVLKRGENIDDLVLKTDELSVQAKAFYKTARKTNACCHAF